MIVPRLKAVKRTAGEFSCGILHLGAESVFMETDDGGMTGGIVYGEDIETAGAFADVAFGEEMVSGAGDEMLFAGSDAEFGKGGEVVANGAGADFNEGESFAVVADEVDFTFGSAWSEIPGDEDVAMAAEVPIGIGFAADAGPAGGEFSGFRGNGMFFFAKAAAGGEMDGKEDKAREEGHRVV